MCITNCGVLLNVLNEIGQFCVVDTLVAIGFSVITASQREFASALADNIGYFGLFFRIFVALYVF